METKRRALALGETDRNRTKTFLYGPAGSGKTTFLQQHLVQLLASGEPGYSILLILAESDHIGPFVEVVKSSSPLPLGELNPTTFSGLARQMVKLFWPLIARDAGFSRPHHPPIFLSYDLAQLLMGKIITPMLDQGAFSGLVLRRQAVISQILDTLNRAALNRLTIEEAASRQIRSWAGSSAHRQALKDAAEAAEMFRRRCFETNCLDYSLTVQVFERYLLLHPKFRSYFSERYRHLLVDNLEEQTPAGQHFLYTLAEASASALLVFDQGGGYKRFLAADPRGAVQLSKICQRQVEMKSAADEHVGLKHLANMAESRLLFTSHPVTEAESAVRTIISSQFRGGMVAGVITEMQALFSEGVKPEEVVLVAPYLDSGLIFSLEGHLSTRDIAYAFLKRRAVPRDDPRVRSWLTWAALAHPSWGIRIQEYDLAEAFTLSFTELDPVRAHLLASALYDPEAAQLKATSTLPDTVVQRLDNEILARLSELHTWLGDNGNGRFPADAFFYKMFHELLGQPRFKSGPDYEGAAICDWLVRTAKRLRRAATPLGLHNSAEVGSELYNAIQQGMVAARAPAASDSSGSPGITVATVHSYLLVGKPARYQIWLDLGSTGWWDIPRQPLSNAFVLNPGWSDQQEWSVNEDIRIRNELLSRVIRGLVYRCQDQVILASSDLDRRGIRQEGPLFRALQVLF